MLLAAAVWAPAAEAQYFGRNKIEYDRFEFRVAKTEHFDLYYDAQDAAAVADAARLAERWHDRLARALNHTLSRRQPLVLYGSHPEFAQTNVVDGFLDEGIGGVTESLRRRIVMPLGFSLAETDHVLGHEIVHAFQYDIAALHGASMYVPLWFAEGMAEYLSVGAVDPQTTLIMRDAVAAGRLPPLASLDRMRLSPYRVGHAFWSWIASRFGDHVVADVLKQKGRSSALDRLKRATCLDAPTLEREWHAALRETFGAGEAASAPLQASRAVISRTGGGRLNVAPALSPDGRHIAFLSERDRLSVDLFLAETATGRVVRKLTTTAVNLEIESLQALRSAGAWSPDGRRLAFAVVRGGRPTLAIFDVARGRVVRSVKLPTLGDLVGPTWSPDGGAIAFTALAAGVTDLYRYDLAADRLVPLTSDAHADLQAAWSPDGRAIAFVTDRYTTDRAALAGGRYELAVLDVASGDVRRLPSIESADHYSPQWTPDGSQLLFVTNHGEPGALGRLDIASGRIDILDRGPGAISGLMAASPALSVARDSGAVAFSVYRRGAFEIHLVEDVARVAHVPYNGGPGPGPERPGPPGAPATPALDSIPYRPRLTLDGIVQPYLATGGSSFGSFVRGGTSLFFGDMLGGERLAIAVQAGSRRSDLAAQVRYLNRDSRWNWGVVADVMPYARGRTRAFEEQAGATLVRESERQIQFHARLSGLLSYPFSRTRRIEFGAGMRHVTYEQQLRRREYTRATGRLVEATDAHARGAAPVGFLEASAALVTDRAVYGPVGPVAGERWRLEVAPSAGGLQFTSVLADYRRYVMPVRPYTIAARLLHTARYGADADDPRLIPMFAGYRHLVRGYDATAFGGCDRTGDCDRFDALFGSRLLVSNVELRVPIAGVASRELRYGPLPAEAFLFADAGVAWTGADSPAFAGGPRRLVRSIGAGARINALGMIVEIGAARPLDRAKPRWTLLFNLRPSF